MRSTIKRTAAKRNSKSRYIGSGTTRDTWSTREKGKRGKTYTVFHTREHSGGCWSSSKRKRRCH